MSETNNHGSGLAHVNSLSPKERWLRDVASCVLVKDPAQGHAIEHVERLYQELMRAPMEPPTFFERILGRSRSRSNPVRGLYLWGSVGRGKTYIIDTFFDCVNGPAKLRIHFHSFMRRVHAELKNRPQAENPLALIARQWSSEFRLLCLDEFHVGDITDAMILANLLDALFAHGVTLVATSNEAPSMLYRDGLQRDRFLPAIALLEQYLEVVELAGDTDYRLRALEQAGVYFTPHDKHTQATLLSCFDAVAPDAGVDGGSIDIDGRQIETHKQADGVVWFDFATLCAGPRSTGDYIEIALCHHTIVLADIPVLGHDASDAARRFINLIDELYDRNVKLIASAAAPAEELYQGSRLSQPFKRTASRLREMQSHDYLARPHLCE